MEESQINHLLKNLPIPLDFNEKNVYKFKGTYDIVHEVLIVDYKEGKLNG